MKKFFLKNFKNIFLIILLIFVGFVARLMDLPPNFSPLASIALFSAFYFRKKSLFFLPIAILFLSDLILGFYQWQIMLSVYVSFIMIMFLGGMIKKRSNVKLLFASLAGAIIFFLVTNFSVWFFSPWYEKTFEGLLLSYTLALPFFKNTVLGNLFFTFMIFSIHDVLVYVDRKVFKNIFQRLSFMKFFILCVLLVSLSACSAKVEPINLDDNLGGDTAEKKEFVVSMIIKNSDEEKSYKATVGEGETVIDLMQKIQDQGDMKFFKKDSSLGAFVEEINGVPNNVGNSMFWMFYINGEPSSVGASMYELKEEDKVEWRFEDASEYGK